jgi:hypothetical protein
VIAPIADFLYMVATSSLFRLAVLLAALAALVRLKIRIGRVLVTAPFIGALLFWNRGLPGKLAESVTAEHGAFFFEAATLVGLIALIDIFGRVLKETESLPRLMQALKALFTDRRIALGGMPAVIGLLPMPGGAMVSAPLVREMANESPVEISPENRMLVNYWFRHMWEYIFPVYPAVVAAAATWKVDLAELVSRQAVLTFAAVAAGFGLVLIRVRPMLRADASRAGGGSPPAGGESPEERPIAGADRARRLRHLVAVAKGLAPIAAVLGIWFGLRTLGPAPAGCELIDWRPWGRTSVLVALVAVIAALAIIGRLPPRWFLERVKRCMPLDMFLMIVGVVVFQSVMKSAGAVEGLAGELEGAPLFVVIFLLPFAAGLLTGIAFAFVMIAFPLLAGIVMVGGSPDPAATVLAYAAGYMGVMLSPVHICLVLTRDYFGAKLGAVYLRLLPPAAVVLGVAFTVYFTQTRL